MLRDENYASQYQDVRGAHWNAVARKKDNWTSWGAYYHKRLIQMYQLLVAPGQRALEFGCGTGDLLTSLRPAFGIGIDFSREMGKRAAQRHPDLHFIQCDAHQISLSQEFEAIILSDLVNHLWNVQTVFSEIWRLAIPRRA